MYTSRVETDNKVISSGILNMHVNPIKLLDMGEIDFDETARLFHKEKETWFKKRIDKDRDLIELWEKRVNSERKCPMCYLTKMRLMTTFNQFRNSHARY